MTGGTSERLELPVEEGSSVVKSVPVCDACAVAAESVAKWPKDAEHNAGDRYLRVYVSVVALGRFMDFEVRL